MGELERQSGEVLGQHATERQEVGLCGDQGGGVLPFLNPTLPQRAFVRDPTSNSLEYQHYGEGAARGSEQSLASQELDRQVTSTRTP